MLERVARDENLVEWRPSRKTFNQRRQNVRSYRNKLSVLTARFRNAFRKSVEGIIEAGRVLIEAKSQLEHGQFMEWVERDLRFGTPQEGDRGLSLRKVEMLMLIAKNEVISNSNHWCDFPPSWRTLWELAQIRPKRRLLGLIETGKINPGMTREEAIALRRGPAQEHFAAARLKRELASLVDVCILLGGGDGVLAHIRDLKEMTKVPPAKEIDKATRWMKQKLAQRRRQR